MNYRHFPSLSWHPRWRGAAGLVLAVLLVLAAVAALLRYAPKPTLASQLASSTAIYDDQGRLLRLALAADDRYRLWVPLERISPQLVEAFLLKEDRHFYWHPGVEPFALLRAGLRTASGSGPRQGGSTISMQLARLLYRLKTRSIPGKMVQVLRALQLELFYSKHDILEAYLNVTPFGANIEGVAAASLIYYGKRADHLSLAEALTLAVIPQAPARRGLGKEVSANLVAERARLFEQWVERYPQAREEAGLLKLPLNLHSTSSLPFHAPHATALLLARSSSDSPQRDSEIHATLDLRLQRALERQVQRYVAQARRVGVRNASAMLVDTRTMGVRAMVGSADFFDGAIEGQVNGTLAKRSPGSALKPFIYALAIDQGLIHPHSVLKDAPTSFGPYSPENFDGGFIGPVTATEALVRSRNIPAVALAARLQQPNLYGFLRQAGISRLAGEAHYGLALALGGGEVTMEEMVTLYAMLANRGALRPLRYRATDRAATVTRLLSEEASFMTLAMLHENARPDGNFSGARSSVRVGWKTGTSWGFRDAWSVGVFGPYVLAVWIGNFNGEGNPAFVGVQAAAPLFFRIVDAVSALEPNLAEPEFALPRDLIQVEVCAASGDLPNAYCPLRTKTWFIAGKSPIRVSDIHRPVMIDTRTGRQACPPFEARHSRVEVFEFWPSDIQRLFRTAGMPRKQPPLIECGREVNPGPPPIIMSPMRGAEYELRAARIAEETVPLMANSSAQVRTLYWFVDDAYVGESRPGAVLAWKPNRAGRFVVRAVDEQGHSDVRELRVAITR